jgi:ribonucleotide monophosphatase NagD (HAD superfamily)
VVQRGEKLIYCGGALAQLYESLGGRVLMAGKPYRPIYELALAEAAGRAERPIDRARVLCIGDGLPTDIRGANAQALDALFVAGGIHAQETLGPGGLIEANVADLLHQEALTARWAIPELVW